MSRVGLRLTPHGRLAAEEDSEAAALDDAVEARLVAAFAVGSGQGLLQLGAGEVGRPLPPLFVWWRAFAARYVEALCLGGSADAVTALDASELATLALSAPMMTGAEYLTGPVLERLWDDLGQAAADALTTAGRDLQSWLKTLNPAWNLVGRVHFNLAENKADPDRPFAFMATYTTRLTAQARAQHVPLGQALREYAGADNRDKLLSLLAPVQRAAETCAWLGPMIEAGEIFHPLRWSAREAAAFLGSAEALEHAGVIVRMPASWRANRPARPKVTATVGAQAPSTLGLDAMLDFQMAVTLDGETLSQREIGDLLAGADALVLLRGQWVEIDRDRLKAAMERFAAAEALSRRDGLTFAQAMRLLSGAAVTEAEETTDTAAWGQINAGPWLAQTLRALRDPGGGGADPGPALRGTLRPYQRAGAEWMRLLAGLGLGACLADDMGLGKTIQILALLLVRARTGAAARPNLLVAPASLLANWAGEIERFAPSLKTLILHPSMMAADEIKRLAAEDLAGTDLVITTYGSVARLAVVAATDWSLVILDEAQAIKNPAAKQTKAAKALKARARIALTGTPVENHLGDLWSIFDFINPGLLGGARQFSRYAKSLAERGDNPYGPLRALVRPYILRRMKTDKAVIADLPDKTEVTAHCNLSRKQAALYAQSVSDLKRSLEESDGMQRRGLVLAMLMRLKQICNHPSQWLGDHVWAEGDSGKWTRLREIAEVVAARQEKMLVFTQFREMTGPLAAFLESLFGRPGLVLHGDTPVKSRAGLVSAFQADDGPPFFVLSLKAGGSGLTLTAASHVVHFDRWWNPAVENQATDRAFRIGQKKNVLVHRFVCQGTVEERIDAMIESKRALSDELLVDGKGAEINLTEMKDEDLMALVALDLNAATKD